MRYLKLSTLLAMAAAFALTLSATPETAEAGRACKRLKLSNNCVVSSDVKNLKAGDIRDEAGGDFVARGAPSSDPVFDLPSTSTVVLSVEVTAPRPGLVLVNASGTFAFSGGEQQAVCEITTATFLDFTSGTGRFLAENDDLISAMPFASTRGFEVSAGTLKVNLVCRADIGTPGVFAPQMTALYVPTRR